MDIYSKIIALLRNRVNYMPLIIRYNHKKISLKNVIYFSQENFLKTSFNKCHKIKNPSSGFALLLEQVRGIEPPYQPWQGRVLPLNYTCNKMAVQTGIEPAISSVTGRHVNHYTTEPFFYIRWRRWRDLNPRASFPTYTLSRGTSSAS
jgi:hypothetical protein